MMRTDNDDKQQRRTTLDWFSYESSRSLEEDFSPQKNGVGFKTNLIFMVKMCFARVYMYLYLIL